MHDNKEILMQRVTRTLKERILPFEYTTVSSNLDRHGVERGRPPGSSFTDKFRPTSASPRSSVLKYVLTSALKNTLSVSTPKHLCAM